MWAHCQPQHHPKRWTWRWSGRVALAPGQQPGRGDKSLLTPSLEPIPPCPQPPATLAARREFAFVVFVTSAGVLGRATLRARFGGGAKSEPGAVENPGAPGASRAASATSLVQKRSRDTRQHVAGGSPCARLRANHRVESPATGVIFCVEICIYQSERLSQLLLPQDCFCVSDEWVLPRFLQLNIAFPQEHWGTIKAMRKW